jgi:hypothetical protein
VDLHTEEVFSMNLFSDLAAELELTMVPSLKAWQEPAMRVPASEQGEATRRRSSSRTFWCALKNQEVEVEFETKQLLGFPRPVGVNRCSAFDEPAHVACGRRCLDSKFRRQWPFALPVPGHRHTLGR